MIRKSGGISKSGRHCTRMPRSGHVGDERLPFHGHSHERRYFTHHGAHLQGSQRVVQIGLHWSHDSIYCGTTDRQEIAELNPHPPSDTQAFVHASVVLQRLHDEAPKDRFTLSWLVTNLRNRSFGMIMLLLALAAIAPGVSIVAGLLLMIPAYQMIIGHSTPIFPRRIAAHSLPTRHLAALVQRAIPVLRHLETIIHPRWPTPLEATKRVVGTVVFILSTILAFSPIPLTNLVPALLIALISLAYLEQDGLLLVISLLGAVTVLTGTLVAIGAMLLGARWIDSLW